MLAIADLHVDYDGFLVLHGVSLDVARGEIVCILGPNGAGKSTLMNVISGLVPRRSGVIRFRDDRIDGLPTHEIVSRGIAHVLERRHVFPYLTVAQNLLLGAFLPLPRKKSVESLERALMLFPALRSRLRDQAGKLSGGLQQQVAIARGLMASPALLLLDEPFLGLSPAVVEDILAAMVRIREDGVTLLFIEQNVERALEVSDRGYILEGGRVAVSGTSAELLGHPRVREVYLGG